jgi:hypothetical protein
LHLIASFGEEEEEDVKKYKLSPEPIFWLPKD